MLRTYLEWCSFNTSTFWQVCNCSFGINDYIVIEPCSGFWITIISTVHIEHQLSLEPSSTNVCTWWSYIIFGSPASSDLPSHHPSTEVQVFLSSCCLRVWNSLFFSVFHYCPFFVGALPITTLPLYSFWQCLVTSKADAVDCT